MTKKKLLIIDDEEHIRLLYSEELSEAGYAAITAEDGHRLLERIEDERPDAIILDIKLQCEGYDGLDLLQEIRGTYFDLPVILCTAYDTFREDIKTISADSYVIKSFDLTELKRKLDMVFKGYDQAAKLEQSNPKEYLINKMKYILNRQPAPQPVLEKVTGYDAMLDFTEHIGFFTFVPKDEMLVIFRSLCSTYYEEYKNIMELGVEYLLKRGNEYSERNLRKWYKEFCPSGLLLFDTFDRTMNRLQREISNKIAFVTSSLINLKKKIEEFENRKSLFIDLMKMLSPEPSNQIDIDSKLLIKHLDRTLNSISDKAFSQIPIDELRRKFKSNVAEEKRTQLAITILRDIRHDLKSSTSSLHIYLSELREILGEDTHEIIEAISNLKIKLSSLVNRLYDLSFYDIVLNYESVDIRLFIEKLLGELGLSESEIMDADFDGLEGVVYIDSRILGIALRQVIQNAIEAIGPKGSIKLNGKFDRESKLLMINVRDNGVGIPQDLISKIYQSAFSFNKKGHSGMGLTIAQMALSQVGGKIEIKSKEGSWAEVKISISSEV